MKIKVCVLVVLIIELLLIFNPKTDMVKDGEFIKTNLSSVIKTYMVLGLPKYDAISKPVFSRGYTNASHTGYQILGFYSDDSFKNIKNEIVKNNVLDNIVEKEDYFEGDFNNTRVTIKKSNQFYSYSIWPINEYKVGDVK